MHVAFYAEQLYYLPQYAPVIAALLARGHRVTTLVRLDASLHDVPLPAFAALGPAHELLRVENAAGAYRELRRVAPQWAVFGSFIDPAETLASGTKTALIYHGIGVKNVLFDPRLNRFDLRCVESQRVFDELIARDPAARDRLALVGFAKLDPLFAAGDPAPLHAGEAPVLLYAPTFYPSSLELMPKELRSLAPEARWIVKPHFFSWTVKEYAAQRKRLELWAKDPQVEVLGPQAYDLVPLMARADVLLSDASSALFEFAALRKPVVWCRFLKLRWTYRGPLAFRLRKRIDPSTSRYEAVARCADRVDQLPSAIAQSIADRAQGPLRETPERKALIEHLIGTRDGHAAERIADALEARPAGGGPAFTAPGG